VAPLAHEVPASKRERNQNYIKVHDAETERSLALLGSAVDRFLDRCEDTVRYTDNSTRCWLRTHVRGTPYKVPFELPGCKRSKKVYRNRWKGLRDDLAHESSSSRST
jgi:hypothetical protein